jgi:glycosyltransferase involved in cell wall biosynthesis
VRKTRIAFVASTLGVGGAENVLFNLVTRLPSDRFEPFLFFLRAPGSVGLRLVRCGVPSKDSIERARLDPWTLGRLASLLRSTGPEILFSLDHHNAMFWGRLASLAARVPRRVVASHSTGRMESRRSFTAADRALMRWTDAVVALSGAHAAYLRDTEGVEPGKIVVIENGIDTGRYENPDNAGVERARGELGLAPCDRVVSMIAALRPEKAHEALLEAAGIMARRRSDLSLKFLVVGGGPRRGEIERLVADGGLRKTVLLAGERDDVPEILRLSGALVLPSHAAVETLPLVVLEAMAAGVPVVASAVGSVPEIIESGKNGLLIPPADPVGLSEALCHIFDERENTQRMIERARDTVRQRYTVEKMLRGYVDLFDRLTARTRAPG